VVSLGTADGTRWESETPTYYYQTYVKVDGKWRLRTNDHVSFDMRRTFTRT